MKQQDPNVAELARQDRQQDEDWSAYMAESRQIDRERYATLDPPTAEELEQWVEREKRLLERGIEALASDLRHREPSWSTDRKYEQVRAQARSLDRTTRRWHEAREAKARR